MFVFRFIDLETLHVLRRYAIRLLRQVWSADPGLEIVLIGTAWGGL